MDETTKKSLMAFVLGCIIGAVLVSAWLPKSPLPENQVAPEALVSRSWIEHGQTIVMDTAPTPPESARFYAYIATTFHDVLEQTDSTAQASLAVATILAELAPDYREQTAELLATLHGTETITLESEGQTVLDTLIARTETDGFLTHTAADVFRPTEAEHWVGEDPLSPEASLWQTWALTEADDPEAAVPPVWGSDEHQAAIEEIRRATEWRTPEQVAAINFWAGAPGSVAPAGIWQNRLWDEVSEYNLSELEYAYAQMVLAQGVADSFIECWQEKFKYWTKRPTMDDPSLIPLLGMENPHFPSYVSGHSTISRTAAEVLSALFPDKREQWLSDAAEARDSRLWGGVHFAYDNDEGFVLGEEVGQLVNQNLQTQRVR